MRLTDDQSAHMGFKVLELVRNGHRVLHRAK
jgi:hypothetical protein